MTDEQTQDPTPVNDASLALFAIEVQRHQQAVNELAAMAMRVDKVNPETHSLDLRTMTYVPKVQPA